MSSDHEVACWLESVPLRSLTHERERRLLDAVRAGVAATQQDSSRAGLSSSWWQAPIPLWKAAIACAALAAAAAIVARRPEENGRPTVPTPIRIQIEEPLVAQRPVLRELDISQWRPVFTGVKE